jgi:chemotaxis protein histidine kinase CheA
MKDKDLLVRMKIDFLRDLPGEIDKLKKDFVRLKNEEKEAAERIKRMAHSIKSCASFFPELEKMRSISYNMEMIFSMIENGKLKPTGEILKLAEDTGNIIARLGQGEDIDLKNMEALFDGYLSE